MVGDEGTLATTAQVLLAIGQGASAEMILEANTNIWILQAEALIFLETDTDYANATIYAALPANVKQALAICASSKAAMFAINQNQDNWQLATSQSKLNVLDFQYNEALDRIKEVDL
jgi:hypothetical protein